MINVSLANSVYGMMKENNIIVTLRDAIIIVVLLSMNCVVKGTLCEGVL